MVLNIVLSQMTKDTSVILFCVHVTNAQPFYSVLFIVMYYPLYTLHDILCS